MFMSDYIIKNVTMIGLGMYPAYFMDIFNLKKQLRIIRSNWVYKKEEEPITIHIAKTIISKK